MTRKQHICKGLTYCECGCHMDGFNLMHFMSCCDLCYNKYIDAEGNIDMERVNKAVNKVLKWRKKNFKSK